MHLQNILMTLILKKMKVGCRRALCLGWPAKISVENVPESCRRRKIWRCTVSWRCIHTVSRSPLLHTFLLYSVTLHEFNLYFYCLRRLWNVFPTLLVKIMKLDGTHGGYWFSLHVWFPPFAFGGVFLVPQIHPTIFISGRVTYDSWGGDLWPVPSCRPHVYTTH